MKLSILFTLVITVLALKCDEPFGVEKYSLITVKNNSNQEIAAYDSRIYPDTSLAFNKPYLINIPVNDYNYLDSKDHWKEVIQNLPSDTLSVFILNSDTVDAYDWSKIVEDYNILKRYDLSYDDLESMDWTITYP